MGSNDIFKLYENNKKSNIVKRLPIFEEITANYQENFLINDNLPFNKVNFLNEIKDYLKDVYYKIIE